MAQALSMDLRTRLLAAVDSGLSCRAAAARLGVSVSSAIRWRRRALEPGRAVAKPRGGDRHSGKIEAHGGFIRELIAEQGVKRPFNCGFLSSLIVDPNRGHGPFRGHGLMMMSGSGASTCATRS